MSNGIINPGTSSRVYSVPQRILRIGVQISPDVIGYGYDILTNCKDSSGNKIGLYHLPEDDERDAILQSFAQELFYQFYISRVKLLMRKLQVAFVD